jgi:hypothetical protein
MRRFARASGLLLVASFALLLLPVPAFGMQQQAASGDAAQQQKSAAGKGTTRVPPSKGTTRSKDADKLNNERMSTRGLHRQSTSAKADKPDGESKAKSSTPSTTKPDSQK